MLSLSAGEEEFLKRFNVGSPVLKPESDCKVTLPLKLAPALNVAAPAEDISSVNAVISDPLSFPLNIISLSETRDFIVKSELVRSICPISDPPKPSVIF